jgi:hypothetical protein
MLVGFMKRLGCFAVMFIFLSSFVMAELTISEPFDVYNLGDQLDVEADGLVGADSGNLNVDLICGNNSVNLEKMSARRYGSGEEFSYSLSKSLVAKDLEISDLGDILGGCQVRLMLGDNAVSSKIFTISNDTNVVVSLDKAAYNPGEKIVASIDVVKANGKLLNGFAEGSEAGSFNVEVVEGFASGTFEVPSTAESGIYSLKVHAYDVDQTGILNEGFAVASYSVNQVPSSLVLSLSGEMIAPGDEFSIGAEIYDQAGVKMEGSVSVKVISPENGILDLSLNSGDFKEIDFVANSSVGEWRIVGAFGELEAERVFEMLGVQRVEFDFEESILTVENVGNILYNKSIDVQIGEESIQLDLNVDVGEVRKFSLDAPNGEYEVVVGDGDNSINRQVLLTGNAVSVSDLKEVGIFKNYSIVWVFLIIIVGAIGTVLVVRFKRTKVVKPGKDPVFITKIKSLFSGKIRRRVPKKIRTRMDESLHLTNKSPAVQGLDSDNYSHKDKSMVDMTDKNVAGAESTLVLKGEKYMSAVISLSVKNHESMGENAKNALQKIVGEAQNAKGLVDWRGDYVFVVFSPIITKTYKNEILAVKEAEKIKKALEEYNKKFKEKIEFNLGVHCGELVASKRISYSDSGRVIISEEIRKKLLRELKLAKGKDLGGNLTHVVLEVKDRSGDAARLKDLMKRHGN